MMRLKNIVSRKLMPLFMRSDQFDVSLGEGLDEIVKDMDAGMDKKEAMKAAAKDRGVSKRDIYQELI